MLTTRWAAFTTVDTAAAVVNAVSTSLDAVFSVEGTAFTHEGAALTIGGALGSVRCTESFRDDGSIQVAALEEHDRRGTG